MIPAAKGIADFRQAMVGQLFGERHRHLPRPRDRAAAPLRQQIRDANLVVFSDGLLNIFHRH